MFALVYAPGTTAVFANPTVTVDPGTDATEIPVPAVSTSSFVSTASAAATTYLAFAYAGADPAAIAVTRPCASTVTLDGFA